VADRSDLELGELLSLVQESRLLDVHTACMAIVQSYDPLTNTVIVQPAVKRRYSTDDAVAHETLPLIQNVPVQWTGGGGFELRFPISAGDTVLLVFSMWADAVWRETGQVSEPVDATKHGLSYAKAIPMSRASSYATPDAQLVAPSPFTVGELENAHFVAIANAVNANFQAIKDLFSSWTPVPNDGGAALKALSGSLSFLDTACTKLKAE
jgi:hypothetical protein